MSCFFVLLIMPPSKVCPQCKAVVPLWLKVCIPCEHVPREKPGHKTDMKKSEVKLASKLCRDTNSTAPRVLHFSALVKKRINANYSMGPATKHKSMRFFVMIFREKHCYD